jgi:hypothetical protein
MIVMRGYLGGDADYLCRRSSVIVVAPAFGATPVWQKVGARGPERFSDTASGEAFRAARERILAEAPKGLSPQAVDETVWTALTARGPKLRYAPARRPILDERLAHVLPRPRVDRIYARHLGLRPDGRVGADAAHPPSMIFFARAALAAAAWIGSAARTARRQLRRGRARRGDGNRGGSWEPGGSGRPPPSGEERMRRPAPGHRNTSRRPPRTGRPGRGLAQLQLAPRTG